MRALMREWMEEFPRLVMGTPTVEGAGPHRARTDSKPDSLERWMLHSL